MAVVRLYPYRTAGPINASALRRPDQHRFAAPAVVESAGADCELSFSATMPSDLTDVLPDGVGVDAIRVLVRLRSRASQLRRAVALRPPVTGSPADSWTGEVVMPAHEWFGRTITDVVAVLAADIEPVPGHAADAGSVLAWSETVTVSFGEPEDRRRGRNLTVEWRSFGDGDDWLRTHREQLFAVEPSDPPIVWLNTDVGGSYQLLSSRGRTGSRAQLHDMVFIQIGHQVWSSLLTAAFSRLADLHASGVVDGDGVGALDELGGWYRAALLDWLPPLYPGFDIEAAADQLLADVATPMADELVMRRVPSAVQNVIRTRDRFDGLFRDAILRQSEA